MPQRQTPGLRSTRALERGRPIASSLALPEQHAGLIAQSHERCQAQGLSRIERPDFAPLGRSDLTVVMDRNRRLHTHAAPVMEMLFDQITGTESMVVLCDATGTVIHSVGDDDFLAKASKVALTPGVNWSEPAKGTNAIGTALVDELPTLVHADEHYLHANHFLTCSAAPILDPRGNILGVLDVTGDRRSYHQHTMALVKMSARMIENHWLADDFRDAMRLHFHRRPEFIGTLMEGILAVLPDGRIVGANRSALDQLGLSGAALRMQGLMSLFGITVGALVDRFRLPLATLLAVRGPGGTPFHVQARFDWPVWRHVADAALADAARAGPPAVALPAPMIERHPLHPAEGLSGLALADLETGDAQIGAVVGKLRRVLDRGIPVLLLGETGTGKERLARAFHHDSGRARHAFVTVHCATVPASQLEAELFGDEEGRVNGVHRSGSPGTAGRVLQADGGTLFLDDVGDLSLPMQAQLLRALQDGHVTPRGSARSQPVDLALVCATQRDLRPLIDAGSFREDLYHHLNGLSLRLPALRERSDLATLVRRLLDGELQAPQLRLAPEVLALFERHAWRGNLRQLFNVLRTAALMAGTEPLIRREHLPDDFVDELPPPASAPSLATQTTSLEALESEAIQRAVEAAGGNISRASQQLGISRNTLYRKLRRSAR